MQNEDSNFRDISGTLAPSQSRDRTRGILKNSKNKTGVRGLTERWRRHKNHDSYQVGITTVRPQKWISPKDHATAKQIGQYLRASKLKEKDAVKDNHFQTLRHRLIQEVSQEHSLVAYRIKERLELQTKQFNFDDSLEQFVSFKSDTSVSMKHRSTLVNVWLPFYREKGCLHPRDFIMWRKQAQQHIKVVKKQDGDERYSIHSWSSLTNAHNEYLKFLLENGDITDTEFFAVYAKITPEMKKRGLTKQSRKQETYTETEVLNIKEKIDATYADNLKMKLRAYAIYIGVCSGIRRGNLLGLLVDDLQPDAEIPHLCTRDNIVAGWSRGEKGDIVLENSSKTIVGVVKLPFLLPTPDILVEVARFLKAHIKPGERLLNCSTGTVDDWWAAIAKECGFKFLTPHDWKHSYATIGALHLHDWYMGNPYYLQMCCMHQKYETTLKYINQRSDNLLKAFQAGWNQKTKKETGSGT
jgi:integrase